MVSEVHLLDKSVDVGEDLLRGHAGQGVAEEGRRGGAAAAQDRSLATIGASRGLLVVRSAMAAGVAALGLFRSLDVGTRGRHDGDVRVYYSIRGVEKKSKKDQTECPDEGLLVLGLYLQKHQSPLMLLSPSPATSGSPSW